MTAVKAAVIGSGNIGTDLMIKIMRLSEILEMGALVGIDPDSDGLARARRLGVPAISTGVEGLVAADGFDEIEIVFDATSAASHVANDRLLREHGKRLVSHGVAGNPNRVSQPKRFLLAHVAHVDHVGDLAHFVQQVFFAPLFENPFQFVRNVEMVFDGVFPTSGYDRDIANTRAYRFLDHVLDQRLVDERQHLFRLSLGCRQKTRTQAGRRKDCFRNAHASYLPLR